MARILICDDEPHVRQTLGRILRRQGHECVYASNAIEAQKLFEQSSFEIVMTDLNMPGPSGLELAAALRALDEDAATIVITGEGDPRFADIAIELGAYAYIVKPFEPNEIVISIRSALRRRALEIEARKRRRDLELEVKARTKQLQETAEALRRSREELLTRLTKAAEFRDNETAEHVQRMSRYCALIGSKLGMGPAQCEKLRLASVMHDVGKIGISDAILLNPGKLTDEEYETMKTHAEIGARILSGSSSAVLQLAETIALTHHERYDGSGYPRGLAGEEIPLEGRIAAVADVFDAVTSKRVYRDAMSVDEGVELLESGRGRHFDPELVDLFVASLEAALKIKQQFADGSANNREQSEDAPPPASGTTANKPESSRSASIAATEPATTLEGILGSS